MEADRQAEIDDADCEDSDGCHECPYYSEYVDGKSI